MAYEVIDVIEDGDGDVIKVCADRDEGTVWLHIPGKIVILDAEKRDQFVKAFVAATYRAEAPAEAHAGRRDGHGEADGG